MEHPCNTAGHATHRGTKFAAASVWRVSNTRRVSPVSMFSTVYSFLKPTMTVLSPVHTSDSASSVVTWSL